MQRPKNMTQKCEWENSCSNKWKQIFHFHLESIQINKVQIRNAFFCFKVRNNNQRTKMNKLLKILEYRTSLLLLKVCCNRIKVQTFNTRSKNRNWMSKKSIGIKTKVVCKTLLTFECFWTYRVGQEGEINVQLWWKGCVIS